MLAFVGLPTVAAFHHGAVLPAAPQATNRHADACMMARAPFRSSAATVSSWYDSGARLTAPDMVASWYDSGLRLNGAVAESKPAAAPDAVEWPMRGGVNLYHPKTGGTRPKPEPRPWLNEADWPKRPPPDYLGRPTSMYLTDAQVAAFGGPKMRMLSYPSFEEEQTLLASKIDDIVESISDAVAETERLEQLALASRGERRALEKQLANVKTAISYIATAKEEAAVAAKAAKSKPAAAPKRAVASSGAKGEDNNAAIGAAVAALLAAGAAYFAKMGGPDATDAIVAATAMSSTLG